MTTFGKRLAAVEAAMPAIPCRECRDWPAVVIRRIGHGTRAVRPDSDHGWPLDTLTCPACGRQPRTVIELERYEPHLLAS